MLSRPICDRALVIGAVLLLSACASAGTPAPAPYQVGARTEAPPPLSPPSAASVIPRPDAGPPPLAPAQPAIVGMPSERINLSVKDEDVSDAISKVARQVGLTAIIDPTVRGPVTRTLHNASLNDAMMNLIGNQFQYQVRNGALVVSPIQLVQHTYTVDYLQMSRTSTASTVVSRGSSTASSSSIVSGATGTGTGVSNTAGGLVASGSDVIQSSSNVDVWGELTQQLESILFSGGGDSSKATGSSGGSKGTAKCAPNGTCLRISPLTSLVDITATPEKQEEVSRYIGLFSASITRQVSIKAQVVEVGLDRSHTFGIDWMAVLNTAKATAALTTTPNLFPADVTQGITTGTSSFNLGLGDFSLRAVLTALQSVGDVSVVATPSTNAMNQQKASFNVTRQQQFFTVTTQPVLSANGLPTGGTTQQTSIQTATVGLVFDVLPQISHDNVVTMAIRPSVTSLVGSTPVVVGGVLQGSVPIIDTRETDTMARVRSGETIMIGGLIQKQTTTTRSGIPILMNLPGIGRLFSKTEIKEKNSELVIFLTPEIVSGQAPGRR